MAPAAKGVPPSALGRMRGDRRVHGVVGEEELVQAGHLQQLPDAVRGVHQHQLTLEAAEAPEVADQLADARRVDEVDAAEVDDHVPLVVGQRAVEGLREELGALAELDHALDVEEREAPVQLALLDDHGPMTGRSGRQGWPVAIEPPSKGRTRRSTRILPRPRRPRCGSRGAKDRAKRPEGVQRGVRMATVELRKSWPMPEALSLTSCRMAKRRLPRWLKVQVCLRKLSKNRTRNRPRVCSSFSAPSGRPSAPIQMDSWLSAFLTCLRASAERRGGRVSRSRRAGLPR